MEWKLHLLRARLPIVVAMAGNVALLVFLPIPSEASALDRALGGKGGPVQALDVVLAAAPVGLAIGWPVLCSLRLTVPAALVGSPRRSLCTASVLIMLSIAGSVTAVLQLRECIPAGRLCRGGLFEISRHPIAVFAVLTAISMLILVPSVPNAIGTAWLAIHFDNTARVEEAALEARVGSSIWRAYVDTGEVVFLSEKPAADLAAAAERKNIRWARERDIALLRQIVFIGLPAFLTTRHNTKAKKYDQSKIWAGDAGILTLLSQVECFNGVRLPGYQSVINHVTAPVSGLLAKYSHLYKPGQEQAEPAEAGTEGTKDEAPLGEFGRLILEVAELWNESKLLEKEKKDSKESDQTESLKQHSDMQAEAVKKKYAGL
ncbi:hypothetical protein AB1Y20_015395 [Prymnesium parvum]|uniref:Uncharacterized protein n=1 Tax=Prymnesium parvum TaxID=97485 RepID=A0AB34JWM7_PRYPA